MDSTILKSIKLQKDLKDKISLNCKFILLYKASTDGFEPENFHKKCDNKGATLTILSAN